MLGWALNMATGNASSDAPPTPGPDDTFVDQPDTPAPVFAARAFKRALFGTPAPPSKQAPKKEANLAATKPVKIIAKPMIPESTTYDSPSKPAGILLTPGTGTTRRKRVSFGRDVKANNLALSETGDGAIRTRPKTKLQEALENSRKRRGIRNSADDDARKLDFDPEMKDNEDAEDVWEEVDELDKDVEGTLDLNEPRSQSGRYWKSEFQKYHEEAQAEMEKLVKYKQLAKSYAKAKDAEALDLTERLKEEQTRVVEMEQRITQLANQIGAKPGRAGGGQDEKELLKDLTRQTALALQYRKKVDELEACLKDSGYEANASKRRRGGQPTDREQARELNDARRDLQRARSDLNALEERERKAESEKRELERKLSRKTAQYDSLKVEYDELKDKNRALRDDVCSLKRTSQSGANRLAREEVKVASTGVGLPSSRSKKHEELQFKIDDEARRREMEDASVTINKLQQDFQRTAELKPPAQRRSSADSRVRLSQTPKFDDDTLDLLQHRPIAAIRRSTATPMSRVATRGSKRTMPGRVFDKKAEPGGLASTRATPRRPDILKNVDLARLSSRSRLGLVTERALDSESDPEAKTTNASSKHNTSTRSSLSSDRRAAAIARLEQKRAERKKTRSATPGKENIRH